MNAQVQDMQLDILNATIHVLKKDPGVDQTALQNRERAAIIYALRNKYSMPSLLTALQLARSSYYYQQSGANRRDKYDSAREKIRAVFEENHQYYGYRRIHAVLKN